jgi:F-type H+-transporting ATPase subunit delta
VRIITSKGRESLLHEVAGQYLRQIRVKKGIMTASVVTATPLDDASRTEIHRLVKKLNEQREIVITETVDPEIIGGFVLKVEDKMVDASVLSHFRKLRMEFTKNLYEAAI